VLVAISPKSSKIWFLIAALCCISPAFGFSEAGSFVFRTYSPKAYLANQQNWAAIEDSRGVMYFGNTDGLLEFDGVTWRRIPLPNAQAVRSLALSDKGRLYVGGQNELGYLDAEPNGAMKYVSLVDKIDPAERSFGDVWSILFTPAGVFFSTTEKLILYNPSNGIRIWKAKGRLRRAFIIDGALHVHVLRVGLHKLTGEQLDLVPGGDQLANLDVRGVFQSSRGTTLATTKGFFFKTDKGYEEWKLSLAKTAQEAGLFSVAQINPELIALGSARGGLLLVNSQGELQRTLNKESGLPSDYIAGITTDRQGGVWLATGNGIVRFAPRLTFFNEASGLRGALISIKRWKGTLYAGTTSGLFKLIPAQPGREAQFAPVDGFEETIWNLNPTEKSLWVGTQSGLFEYDGKKSPPRTTNKEVVYDTSFSRKDPQTMFVAMRSTAHVLRYDGKEWAKVNEIPSKGEEFRTIADDENGIVWATTRSSIVRADISQNPPSIQVFTEQAGLPKGWINAFRISGRLLFATEQGLVKYNAANKTFVQDDSLGPRFASKSMSILLMREDSRGSNVWISGTGYHGVLRRPFQKDMEWRPMPLVAAGFEDLWDLYSDADGTAWAAGSDGRLVRLESGLNSSRQLPFEVLIRRLQTSDTRQIISEGATASAVTIPPNQNSLRLEFSAPFFDAPERVEYQVALDSPIDEKTPWTSEAWKDLSNLWEGSHKLRVRARSPYGEISPETSLSLAIQPPWFRTWWAYSFYGAVLGSLIWGVFRWRLRSNRRLEVIVEERTTEIRQQRDQIIEQEKQTESLLLNILPAPVAAELKTNGAVAPMRFDDVTVCFTDFVGFTLSSEKITAEELVAKLHEYFTEFDKIIAKYGLEKLKTIGDSYMFVSGLPQRSPQHAEMAVRAALEILEKSKELGLKNPDLNWRLRVGLHSGPVVAGVVGFKKFAFDIWGDTVNLASRMESSGAPNRVNVSERTHQLIEAKFECEDRGMVKTKDGRDLPMYFANSYKTTLEPSRAMIV
jgi:class 3 adenylate cyclase